MDFCNISALKNLLDQCKEDKNPDSDTDSEGEDAVPRKSSFGPGSIGKKRTIEVPENSVMKKLEKLEIDSPKNLEEWVELEKEDEDFLDSRKVPEHSIAYKQGVTTEDVYLGLSRKTPSSFSCEDMVIEIKLPEETVKIYGMDLSVLPEKIDLKTPIYRLKMDLPHKIDPNKSRAEYDSGKKVLKLTLRLKREFDFVNF